MGLVGRVGRRIAGIALATALISVVLTLVAGPLLAYEEYVYVKPNHGQASAYFKATFEIRPAPDNCEQYRAWFSWDGATVASNLPMERIDSGIESQQGRKLYYCRASAEIIPPASKRQVGTHEVRGGPGYSTAPAAPVTYTIDPPPAAAPPPSEAPPGQSAPSTGSTSISSQQTAPKQGKTTTSSSPSAAISAPASEVLAQPAAPVTDLSPSPAPSPQAVAARVSQKSQPSGLWIWLIGGVALLTAVAVALILRRKSRLSKEGG